MRRISNNQLTPDATYLVRGQVGFGIITRHTTDAERERQNARRMHKIDKNYSTMSIYNAQVICKDINNPTIEEQYAMECLYKSSSPSYPGNNFTGMNKSRNLPRVGVLSDVNSNRYIEITPEAELATGSDVTLVMRVFKGQGNNGVSLDMVLVNSTEPKYYANNTARKNLEDFGITFEEKIPQRSVVDETPDAETENVPVQPAYAQNVAPATQPQNAPVQGAYASMQGGYTPQQPVAPAQNAYPQGAYQPQQPAAPEANPFSSYGGGNAAGAGQPIMFDAGPRQY